MEVIKVSSKSRPNAVAGALAGVVREKGSVEIQAIGAGAVNQAVKAIAIARAVIDGDALRAARVKRPSRTSPEWQERRLRSSADVRDFVADLKKQLALWSDRDD